MKRRLISFLAAAAILASAAVSSAHTDGTHNFNVWYGMAWRGDINIPYRFTEGFFPNDPQADDRVRDAEASWETTWAELRFSYYSPRYKDFTAYSCMYGQNTYQKNGVHMRSMSVSGRLLACRWQNNANRIWSTQLILDSTPTVPWNTTVGGPSPGAHEGDMWTTAAHEWGHASGSLRGGDGSGHFLESSSQCPDDPAQRQTMCPSAFQGTVEQGWPQADHELPMRQAEYPN